MYRRYTRQINTNNFPIAIETRNRGIKGEIDEIRRDTRDLNAFKRKQQNTPKNDLEFLKFYGITKKCMIRFRKYERGFH